MMLIADADAATDLTLSIFVCEVLLVHTKSDYTPAHLLAKFYLIMMMIAHGDESKHNVCAVCA